LNWRLLGADVFLEFGIERDIALIVAKQIELDLVVARAGEERRIQRPTIGREPLRRGHAVRVLPLGRFGLEKSPQRRPIGREYYRSSRMRRCPSKLSVLLFGL
jgi:hypothetical protein